MNTSKISSEGSDSAGSASSEGDPLSQDALPNNLKQEPPDLEVATEHQIEKLADEYLTRLRQGDTAGYEALVNQYPQLAPHLEARLKFYTAIYRVSRLNELTEAECNSEQTVDFSADAASKFFREKSLRISCPHCGNPVQVVSEGVSEVVCDSCGSSVNVETSRRRQSMKASRTPLPDRLGHFKIVRVLGEGGFGIVYLAEDQQLDSRQVAIKIPRHGLFADSEEEQRFFREARNVARLKHPNIAQVFEISVDRNTPFIVSEFIDGLTLRDLSNGVKLTPLEIVKLLIQIAEAVEFAHQNKIIHRDLKSSNILVDHNRNAFVVDFGLSRRDDPEITMTLAGTVVGTVQYMSPEQAAANHAAVGPKSDVYSLGVILYELLCAELPFHGTKRMMINQVIYEEPKRPRQLNENIPRDLETITLKAMAKKPSQRYASAQEFADDLRRWSRNEPIRARPVSVFVHWWSWCRRHPTTAMLSAVIAALLLLSSAISTIWAIEQSRLKKAEHVARQLSESRLYERLVHDGSTALSGNDLSSAAFWFSQALTIKDSPVNRTRIGLVQDQLPKFTQLWSTEAPIDSIAFSDDGSRIATAAADDGHVHVFNTTNRETVFDQTLPAFSHFELAPQGDKLAICGNENHAQLWDVERGTLIRFLAHTNFVVTTDFHPAEQVIATGGFDSFARVWNSVDGSLKIEHKFDGSPVNRIVFVPGTTLLAVVTKPVDQWSNEITLWDYVNDRVVASGLQHGDHIIAIGFVDDGSKLISASANGEIRTWEAASGKAAGELLQLPFSPLSVFIGNSSDRIVSIGFDSEAQFWNLDTNQRDPVRVRRPTGNAAVAQDKSNRLLALGGSDGTVGVYWKDTGSPACSQLRNGESTSALAFHPDGRRLAIGGSGGVLQLWDLAGAVPSSHVFQHAGAVRNAKFSPDGKRCLTIGLDGKALLWDTKTGQQTGPALEHSAAIAECDVSSDGRFFATASEDKTVKLWDGFSGRQIGKALVHDSPVVTLAIGPKAEKIFTGCLDGSVTLWKLGGASLTGTVVFSGKHDGRVMSVAFNPQRSLVASASLDGEIRCWDTLTGNPKQSFNTPGGAFYCVFLPDGMHLISCGKDAASILNVVTGQIEQRLQCAGDVRSASVFDGGDGIITNETMGRTRVWHQMEGRFNLESEFFHESIKSVYFSDMNPEASILAMSGGTLALGDDKPQAGATVLFDINERRQMGPPLIHTGYVRRVQFDVTGRKLLTASEDHTARLWEIVSNDLPLEDAIRIARLYAQVNYDVKGRIIPMSIARQAAEFAALSENYSSFFSCDAGEIAMWNEDSLRLHHIAPASTSGQPDNSGRRSNGDEGSVNSDH